MRLFRRGKPLEDILKALDYGYRAGFQEGVECARKHDPSTPNANLEPHEAEQAADATPQRGDADHPPDPAVGATLDPRRRRRTAGSPSKERCWLNPAEQKIEALIRAHILALDNDQATAGYVPGRKGSIQHQRSELWQEGERQFLELEHAYQLLHKVEPFQFRHLRARYYDTRTATKTVQRKGSMWIGLGAHQGVCTVTGGERVDRHGPRKQVTVSERVIVETWPGWVNLEACRRALGFVHLQFLRDRVEPCVPSSVYRAA